METDNRGASMEKSGGIDILTLVAFLAVVILGGSNAVAVRFSNFELPPFWGAAIRFAAAALIFWVAVFLRRIEIPRGRALYGALIYGALTIGIPYAFLYWALVSVPAWPLSCLLLDPCSLSYSPGLMGRKLSAGGGDCGRFAAGSFGKSGYVGFE